MCVCVCGVCVVQRWNKLEPHCQPIILNNLQFIAIKPGCASRSSIKIQVIHIFMLFLVSTVENEHWVEFKERGAASKDAEGGRRGTKELLEAVMVAVMGGVRPGTHS